jgi:hypothetical protein
VDSERGATGPPFASAVQFGRQAYESIGLLRRAHAIQEQEIECEEDALIRATFIHRRLEAAEDWHAIAIERA